MKINAGYIRVSTPQKHRANGRGPQEESLPKQRELLAGWFRSRGQPGDLIFFEDDQSGSEMNRKGLNGLIERIESDQVQRLFLYDDSRLARNQGLMHAMLWLCWQHRVEILVYALGRRVNWESADDRMMLGLMGFTSEFFLRNLVRLSREGTERLLRQGCWMGRHPYGFVRGEDKRLEPVPGEWEIIKRIWAEIRDRGVRAIVQRLEADRLAGRIAGWKGSLPWTCRTIQVILSNPAYTGSVVWNQTGADRKPLPKSKWKIVENAHPAVVSWKEFDGVRELLKSRARGKPFETKMRNPYAGFLFCGHHSCKLTGMRRYGMEYLLYCDVLCCPNNGVPVSAVERRIQLEDGWGLRAGGRARSALENCRKGVQTDLKSSSQAIAGLQSRIAKDQKSQQELVMRFGKGELTKSAFEREMAARNGQIEKFKKSLYAMEQSRATKLQELERIESREARLQGLTAQLSMLPYEEKRALVGWAIKRVDLFERSRAEVMWANEGAP